MKVSSVAATGDVVGIANDADEGNVLFRRSRGNKTLINCGLQVADFEV
ncbi:MAG: hypothetical protein WBN75_17530 [Verrucomicrobiia bacterium]